jgi:hypothetical protein
MILSALRKAWAFLGEDRLQLILCGAVLVVCWLDFVSGNWMNLVLSIAILALTLPWSWRALAPKSSRDAKRLAKTSTLAGHQPIGAHVDKPEHRTWRK